MKKSLFSLAMILSISSSSHAQNTFPSSGTVGIGTTSPNTSSLLEVKSTAKGVLFPRMTKAQRDAIVSPVTGLLIYQTDNNPGFYYHNGTSWKAVSLTFHTSNDNVFLGVLSGTNNTTGTKNVAVGNSTLNVNQTGSGNTAIGWASLFYNLSSGNTAVGQETLVNNSLGNGNCALGFQALFSNTRRSHNNAFGYQSLYSNSDGSELQSGSSNNAFGFKSMYSNTSGHNNSAFGETVLLSNTTGFSNTAMGSLAMYSNTTGFQNTATGTSSMNKNINGTENAAFGFSSLYSNTSGSWNTAIGVKALYANTAQSKNTAVGWSAGAGSQSSSSTFIGHNARANNIVSNSVALGINATVTASNQVRIGNSSTTSIGGYTNWSNISDGRVKKNIKANVPGLNFINKLNPITYNLDLNTADQITYNRVNQEAEHLSLSSLHTQQMEQSSRQEMVYTGFIAQDVEKAAKELNFDFSGVDAAKTEKDLYALRYADFVVPLVKAVQELDNKIEDIAKLKEEIVKLRQMVEELKKGTSSIGSDLYKANLDQSIPNPTNGAALIRYYVPLNSRTAHLVFTDMKGAILKSIPINNNGSGQLSLNTTSWAAGTYIYTLYINGTQADSKKLLIVR